MKYGVFCLLLLVSCSFAPVVRAETFYDVSVTARDILFQPDQAILGEDMQVYVTLRNNGTRNVEGSVIFSVDGKRLGVKPFSIRAAGSPEDVWIRWIPDSLGSHTIRAEVVNDTNYPDGNLSDNIVSEAITVDLDTDGDGIPDRLDKDQDNDGLSNEQEKGQSTNPLQKDTDRDGVNDKEDFYPLDSSRTVYVAPVKPVVKPTVLPKPVTAPTTATKTPAPVPQGSDTAKPLTGMGEVTSSLLLVTTTEPLLEEVASSTEVAGGDVVVSPVPVALQENIQVPRSSPYRWLWALAGAAGGAALGFVALDWWHARRAREDG